MSLPQMQPVFSCCSQQPYAHCALLASRLPIKHTCCSLLRTTLLQGCGICQFTTAAAAAIAKSALHGKYKWAEDASPMVVEWVNEDKMRSTCHKAGERLCALDMCSLVMYLNK